jgi:Rrf2 family protein
MLSLSRKAHYGLSAILELAENHGKGVLQIKDIALKRSIPKNYLEQLLNRMLKSGLIKSMRGNKGGYELADSPANISFLQVLESLEGKINLKGDNTDTSAIDMLLSQAEVNLKQTFDVSLQELLMIHQKYNKKVIYHI